MAKDKSVPEEGDEGQDPNLGGMVVAPGEQEKVAAGEISPSEAKMIPRSELDELTAEPLDEDEG